MARPKKIGLDYFPLDVNFDNKFQAFELLHGNDGFVWIIKLWQSAYKNEVGEINLNGLFGHCSAKNSRITIEKQEEYLKTCSELGLLYQTTPGFWTSNGIKKRISEVSKERKSAITRKEKLNQIKGNESKVKETPHCSANNIRTIPEQLNYKKITTSNIIDETTVKQAVIVEINKPINEFREITDYFCNKFFTAHNIKYPFTKEDGIILANMHKEYKNELKSIIDDFFNSTDDFILKAGHGINIMKSCLKKILSQRNKIETKKKSPLDGTIWSIDTPAKNIGA
jgi:hypothetical protein